MAFSGVGGSNCSNRSAQIEDRFTLIGHFMSLLHFGCSCSSNSDDSSSGSISD